MLTLTLTLFCLFKFLVLIKRFRINVAPNPNIQSGFCDSPAVLAPRDPRFFFVFFLLLFFFWPWPNFEGNDLFLAGLLKQFRSMNWRCLSVRPSVCLSTFWLNFWFKQNLSYGYRYMFATWCRHYLISSLSPTLQLSSKSVLNFLRCRAISFFDPSLNGEESVNKKPLKTVRPDCFSNSGLWIGDVCLSVRLSVCQHFG